MAIGDDPHVIRLYAELREKMEVYGHNLSSIPPARPHQTTPPTSPPALISTPASSTSRLLDLSTSLSSGEGSPADGGTPPARRTARFQRLHLTRRVNQLALQLKDGPYPAMAPTLGRPAQRARTALPPPVTSGNESTLEPSAFSPSPPKAPSRSLTHDSPHHLASPAPRPPGLATVTGRRHFPTTTSDKL